MCRFYFTQMLKILIFNFIPYERIRISCTCVRRRDLSIHFRAPRPTIIYFFIVRIMLSPCAFNCETDHRNFEILLDRSHCSLRLFKLGLSLHAWFILGLYSITWIFHMSERYDALTPPWCLVWPKKINCIEQRFGENKQV